MFYKYLQYINTQKNGLYFKQTFDSLTIEAFCMTQILVCLIIFEWKIWIKDFPLV